MLSTSFIEMRKRNVQSILQAVRREPGISRADVAKVCDLAKSTVSSIVDELVQSSIFEESGSKLSSKGRRPVGLVFNPRARASIGISLDDDQVAVAICDLDGSPLAAKQKQYARTTDEVGLYELVLALTDSVLKTTGTAPRNIVGLGIAAPGPISEVSTIINDLTIDLKHLQQLLSQTFAFHCTVLADSNTNMAAIAECRLGAAQFSDEALIVRLGKEVRCALLKNHKLIRGSLALAGALGHVIVPGIEETCSCGKKGCINSLAALDAIVAKCRSLNVKVRDIDGVLEATAKGDQVCRQVLSEAAKAVGIGIAGAINIIAPSDVVITGRLVDAGEPVVEQLKMTLRDYTNEANLSNCNVVFGTASNHIEAIGAGLAAFHEDNFLDTLVMAAEGQEAT